MERREKRMKREHKNIMNALTPYLIRVHHVPSTSSIIQQFSRQLETCLYERYMSPMSYLNIYRLRKEMKLVKAILYRLKKGDLVLRVTDKSGIFHIGNKKDYEQKQKLIDRKLKLIWK